MLKTDRKTTGLLSVPGISSAPGAGGLHKSLIRTFKLFIIGAFPTTVVVPARKNPSQSLFAGCPSNGDSPLDVSVPPANHRGLIKSLFEAPSFSQACSWHLDHPNSIEEICTKTLLASFGGSATPMGAPGTALQTATLPTGVV